MRRAIRIGVRLAIASLSLLMLYLGITFGQVWWESRQDSAQNASAIIVLGAAQWNGKPSPVLQERLDHAAALYQQGLAPYVIVTGGKQAGDKVTQGLAGYSYLVGKGVPDKALKIEVDGTNTYEELSASANIIRRLGQAPTAILVSDPYHMERAEAIASEVGLTPHGSPTHADSSLGSLARETIAVALGRIVSYRRLSNWSL